MSLKTPQNIVTAAAEWVGLLDSTSASDADWLACESWCAAHPLHRTTFEKMWAFHDRLDQAGPAEIKALQSLASKPKQDLRRALVYGFAFVMFAGLSWSLLTSDSLRDNFPDYHTARGEQKTVALASGNVVILDTDTAIRVTERERLDTVRLITGRLLARVNRSPERRFSIQSTFGSATALGTAYEVELTASAMKVSVIESTVRVCPANTPPACETLSPGERASVDRHRVTRLPKSAPATFSSWATGWVEAVNEDLTVVLTELNRYRSLPLVFDPERLKGRRVSGIFPVRDQDAALRGVVTSSGTRLVYTDNGTVSVVN
ncbi:FecR family protein [Asticcacaulis endophyticus]|uniref:FecR family protein n=1 Tax=Asticcacaulis endophyticus TaxID=1395890 RepID=A0A918QBF9_9CAUL|nr:FecR domain-containing protein [Asticcacaulis endophyticus]GGZ39054.1 hypothetical protein GCM10011273_26810 [Asticcacaulis endophyticus]